MAGDASFLAGQSAATAGEVVPAGVFVAHADVHARFVVARCGAALPHEVINGTNAVESVLFFLAGSAFGSFALLPGCAFSGFALGACALPFCGLAAALDFGQALLFGLDGALALGFALLHFLAGAFFGVAFGLVKAPEVDDPGAADIVIDRVAAQFFKAFACAAAFGHGGLVSLLAGVLDAAFAAFLTVFVGANGFGDVDRAAGQQHGHESDQQGHGLFGK